MQTCTDTISAAALDAALPYFLLVVRRLDAPVEWMRYCERCESEQRFVADREAVAGLLGACSKCGEERIAPFTRTNSDDC